MYFLEHSHLLGLFFYTDDAFPSFLGVSPHQVAFDLDGTPHSWVSWKTFCLPLLWPQTEQQKSPVRAPGAVLSSSQWPTLCQAVVILCVLCPSLSMSPGLKLRLKALGKHDSGLRGGTFILGTQKAWQTSGKPLKLRLSFLSSILSALVWALFPNKCSLNPVLLSLTNICKGDSSSIASVSVLFCCCCLNEETKMEF